MFVILKKDKKWRKNCHIFSLFVGQLPGVHTLIVTIEFCYHVDAFQLFGVWFFRRILQAESKLQKTYSCCVQLGCVA